MKARQCTPRVKAGVTGSSSTFNTVCVTKLFLYIFQHFYTTSTYSLQVLPPVKTNSPVKTEPSPAALRQKNIPTYLNISSHVETKSPLEHVQISSRRAGQNRCSNTSNPVCRVHHRYEQTETAPGSACAPQAAGRSAERNRYDHLRVSPSKGTCSPCVHEQNLAA